jgi:ATP-dependent protease HslVU (ClpYQ) peptidase subunit
MKKAEISIKENKKTIALDRYEGEWVAFADGKVVAHQTTLKRLMEKVKDLRKKPSVLLVPKKKEGPYV